MTNKTTSTQKKTQRKTTAKKTTNKRTQNKKLTQNERLAKVIEEVTNSKNTVEIDGKNYVKVYERKKLFRKEFGFDVKIQSIMRDFTASHVVFEAQIFIFSETRKEWELVANGHAFENKASSDFNKHNFLENCETSAIGRALENLSIGNDNMSDSEAVKDKVKASNPASESNGNKKEKYITPNQLEEIEKLLKDTYGTVAKGTTVVLKERKATKLSELTEKDYKDIKVILDDDEEAVL